MQAPDFNSPPFAKTAVMRSLARRGGCLRVAPLLELSDLSVDDLCAVLNELAHRRWLKVTWRRTPRISGPERLRKVDRITATRFGRSRIPRDMPTRTSMLAPRGAPRSSSRARDGWGRR